MKRILIATLLGLALATTASAGDAPAPKLTVEQAVTINAALAQLNCGNKVIKDGTKETLVCEPYKWTPGMLWLIAGDAEKLKGLVTQYTTARNQMIASLARKPDGTPTEDAAAKFTALDREWLDKPADVTLDHFKRSDLEPMGLQPAIVSALMPIID